MKRQIIAVAIGSLFALPAFAYDGEIDAGFHKQAAPESTLTRAQVRAELIAAQRAGELATDGEIGQVSVRATSGKTRAEVVAELVNSQPAGNTFVDGETGSRIPRS